VKLRLYYSNPVYRTRKMNRHGSRGGHAYGPVREGVLALILSLACGVSWAKTGFQGESQVAESRGPRPDSNYEAFNEDTFARDSPYRAAASVVGLILLQLDDEPRPFCSGLLISSKYILTARHCLQQRIANTDEWEPLRPQQIIFELDYLKYGSAAKTYPLKVVPVEIGPGDLDFAVLEAINDIPLGNRKIPVPGGDPRPKEDLYVIHYPGGETLKLTRRECRAADRPEDGHFFRHVCDTEPGSSGAPVFNINFELIGIHTFSGKGQGSTNGGILLSRIMEFTKSAEGWRLLQKSESKTKVYPLVEQHSSTEAFLLWDASADVLYLVPKAGGDVKRREGGEISWANIGKATKE
jgi:V8-like Glu-specific endopeptidase